MREPTLVFVIVVALGHTTMVLLPPCVQLLRLPPAGFDSHEDRGFI